MRELDYSGNFYFTSRISDLSRQNLTNVPWSIKFFIIIRYEIDQSFVVIIIIFSLSLYNSPSIHHHHPSIKNFIVPPSKQRDDETPKYHSSSVQRRKRGRKKKKRKKRKEGGERREEGKGGRDFEKKNTRGARERGKEYFQEGCSSLPLSLPPSLRVEAREVARPTVKRGRGKGGEGKGRSERKTRRNGPTAQQKRDKSSTLIRILPLFALWNTILNGMGAQ